MHLKLKYSIFNKIKINNFKMSKSHNKKILKLNKQKNKIID